jgi:DNA-binding transcriptional LysR family regulator
MNLRQIEVFRAVMLAGTISGASRLLHVSQPGISRMVASIESRLQIRLFERIRGRLHPTPEAQALFAQIQRTFVEVERVASLATELRAGHRLALRVLGSPSVMLEAVPQAVMQLRRRFAQATVQLETTSTADMVAALLRKEADIGVSANPMTDGSVACEVLGAWTLVCAFPKGHAFESRAAVALDDVVQQSLVGFPPETPQGQFVGQWCRHHGAQPQETLQVRSSLNACALVLQGAGVAVVDNLTARAYGRRDLMFLPIQDAPRVDILALSHPQAAPSALVRTFLEELTRRLAQPST